MKKLLTSSRIALRALQVNRTRSALTMLGIIIGVAAVIAMVGIGAGATERIQAQIQSIGSNLITREMLAKADYAGIEARVRDTVKLIKSIRPAAGQK